MGDSETAELGDAARRRRLKFRCWHRGMKEVDLILGRFADATVDGMDEQGLAAFEALLDDPDPQILAWVTGQEAVPADRDTEFFRRLLAFHQ
ncbi:MAG: succinate dehydrogenase assembly factor 2 [Bauldia sp.]